MLEVEKKHSRRSARRFHRDNHFTPSQIFASVYTQEKFTLKFYLTNAIIEDKKIDVDFAPERILEKEKRRLKFLSGGPVDKFDVMEFCLFIRQSAMRSLLSILKSILFLFYSIIFYYVFPLKILYNVGKILE